MPKPVRQSKLFDTVVELFGSGSLDHSRIALTPARANNSVSCEKPCVLEPVTLARDDSFSTHELSPAAVLHTYREVVGQNPPPTELLAIRGYEFELGAGLSAEAEEGLKLALECFRQWLIASPM